MRFIFNTPNNNELSDLADDGGGMILIAPGGLPGQLHRENCMAIGTTSLSACGAYRLSPDCIS